MRKIDPVTSIDGQEVEPFDLELAAIATGIPAETLIVSGLIAKDGAPSQSCIP